MNRVSSRSAILTRSIQAGFLLLLVVSWAGVHALGLVPAFILPSPTRTFNELRQMTASGELWTTARVTLLTIALAYSIAALGGLLLGFLISRSTLATRFWEPVLAWIFAIPLTLFFPLFVLFFGIGPASKVAYGAVYGFFPVVLSAIAAFSAVEPLYIRSVNSMGASRWQEFRHVYLPSALPRIVAGLRVAFFITIAAVLGGETLASLSGIGNAVAAAGELMESSKIYAWLIVVVLATFMLNLLLNPAEAEQPTS
jgi:ABC-type nitrate/sulfonate/bicarbonate transport system permease component